MSQWLTLCSVDQILPACGVCALAGDQQVALFRPYADEQIFALSNIDPFAQASVLSRGIIAEHQGELWVASPLKKQHFRLTDGVCMEDEQYSVPAYEVRVQNGNVEINTARLRAEIG
ncbi:nitrite reductase small subunit NirD [Rahnella aceris]|jgi:nitrite reductase (NADH) small subunit|uniref:nitrite reductase small subunit NirD n=1 Tax=Rahnella sp. (strain Y9602) TaxID=2703885 RepID=UPI0019060A11|nr:nitrite reductase small subunit NirD [Rahnella aceris]QQN34297.1 nitrite reductase small subunit NirD [Rahnella aceris]